MTTKNICLKNEVFVAYISEGQSIYGFMLSPAYIIDGFKAESIDYVINPYPLTPQVKKLINKYKTVVVIKDGNKPRISVFQKDVG